MEKIKTVVFDLFFTLVNPRINPNNPEEDEYVLLGLSRGDFETRYAADYEFYGRGKIRDPYGIFPRVLRDCNFPPELLRRATEARMKRIRTAFLDVREENISLIQQIREAGIRTVVVSDADVLDMYHWKESPLSDCFDEALFSCDTQILKPEPELYRRIRGASPLPSASYLYVGDGGHEELKGAREAGMHTIMTTEYSALLWPERIEKLQKNAEHTVENLPGILPFVFGRNAQ